MQITNIQPKQGFTVSRNKKENQPVSNTVTENRSLSYPKGFRPFFGARLFRTPENFYEQEFNKKGMPKTMKDYLNNNYAVNSKIPPAELSKKAFEKLNECKSIKEVKEKFPNEPLFANLKTLEDVSPRGKGGYLYVLKCYDRDNGSILKSGEDLTVYLLKKIFLESKDLDEINADFDKDKDPNLDKVKEHCNEEYYFLHSTLDSLGIKFPDRSYWKSLQANRADKDYTPYTYTLTQPRKKPENTKPRERKPVNLSPEERLRRRNAMIERWLDMTPEQRAAQLAKMKEGQEGNLMFQYASPIMLIATDKIGLQDKMYAFFKENKEKLGTEAPVDFLNMDAKQRKAMKLFWAQNNRLRKEFSYQARATYAEFERAKEQGSAAFDALINKAEKIRETNMQKTIMRKLVNADATKEELKDIMQDQISPFPDVYGDKYVKFVMKHDKFKDIIRLHVKGKLAKTDEEKKKYIKASIDIMTPVFDEFNKKNKKDGIAAIASLAVVMFPFLEAVAEKAANQGFKNVAQKALDDSDQMLTGNPTCILGVVEKYEKLGSKKLIENCKDKINEAMKRCTSGLSDEELKIVSKEILNYMNKIVNKQGNYQMLNDPEIRNRCSKRLPSVYRDIERNKYVRRDFIEFLKDYEGLIKFKKEFLGGCFSSSFKNGEYEKTLRYKCIQDYLYESIIDDYLVKKENEK
ncbi:hypothetical protein IJS77_02275 [bacterium]|nr:hypothetical protein [bacterium]